MASYFTIQGKGEGLVREKMSRFLSFALPVKSQEEANALIKEYQNRFHDSRHVCWAYVLEASGDIWQLNDNGEPSGTAGKPILGQIRSKNLTDVLVIVVRYFGGIKLGTSGLIVAYREAARLALEDCEVVECHEMSEISLMFPYEVMDGIMQIVKRENLEIIERNFDNLCTLKLRIRDDRMHELMEIMQKRGAQIS